MIPVGKVVNHDEFEVGAIYVVGRSPTHYRCCVLPRVGATLGWIVEMATITADGLTNGPLAYLVYTGVQSYWRKVADPANATLAVSAGSCVITNGDGIISWSKDQPGISSKRACTCTSRDLMLHGCTCGYLKRAMEDRA